MSPDLTRLSLNHMTVRNLSVGDVVALCSRHEIKCGPLARTCGANRSAKERPYCARCRLAYLSLCRGGFFALPDARDENRRAVEQAAELGTDLLVLVCGGMAGYCLDEARQIVRDGIAELSIFAEAHGVRLGIEPLHPMYAASRSVVTLRAGACDCNSAKPGHCHRRVSRLVGPGALQPNRKGPGAHLWLAHLRLARPVTRFCERSRHDGRRRL